MLRVENIRKSFGKDNRVLDSVSFCALKGQAVCIAGKNATGKTTLIKIICGILSSDSGTVSANGRISFISQEPAILPELSVNDNLKLWYASQNASGPHWKDDSIETILGLKSYRRKKAKTLSGGMKKRLSIAAALALPPDWLLMDEPFAAIDTDGCRDIISLLDKLKKSGTGIIFTSHQNEHISAVADRILILNNGTIEEMSLANSTDCDISTQYTARSMSQKDR